MILVLSDKSPAIWNECLHCFDAWIEIRVLDTFVVCFPQFLKNDNAESRMEIMKFIQIYHNNINSNIGERVYKELVDLLYYVACKIEIFL